VKLASLFSGGKDSVFSMYLAVQSGHEVPYLVTVKPENDSSWVFHVPNVDTVGVTAEALGAETSEAFTDGTEAGDMRALAEALGGLDIDGVVTGAVLSDYQSDRINRVCGDLGLAVFSPMWRKDQYSLLREIIDSGIEAYIIGYYAEGFDSSWLGRKIDEKTAGDLLELNGKYGVSVMGEGGEYETLVTDSPMHGYPLKMRPFEKTVSARSGTMIAELMPDSAGNSL
jgi:diphthine-ammonia ligase